MECTSCHLPIDTSDTSPARKKHAEIPTGGSQQDNYKGKFNLNLPMQAWDTGTPMGNPIIGVCYSCHSSYEQHQTTRRRRSVARTATTSTPRGRGSARTYFMIPQTSKKNGTYSSVTRTKAGLEVVTYDTTRLNTSTGAINAVNDFYSGSPDTNLGVCDNAECHTVAGRTPLSTFMTNGSHSGGTQPANSDCAYCHKHNGDPSGGWRASGACSNSGVGCHGTTGGESSRTG